MKWFTYVVCILVFNKSFAVSTCTVPSFANITVQSDFDLNKFLGIWYEIEWLPGTPHNESDIWRNYYQSFQLANSSTQKLRLYGEARLLNNATCFSVDPWIVNANNSAKMILEQQNPTNPKLLNWPYYILTTDYEHYALIYGCISNNYTYINPCDTPILWVFSRTTTLSNNYLDNLNNYIENNLCINLTRLEITPQDGPVCHLNSSNVQKINLIIFIFLSLLYI